MESGLPQNTVLALAQTKDGFLWLGTESGLVRFDGIEFQTFNRTSKPALPGNDVSCLLASSDGALWIGTNSGLALLKDGIIKAFTTRDGLPGNDILALAEGAGGSLVAWTAQGPARQDGGRFVSVADSDGFPRTALPSPGEPPGVAVFKEQMPNGFLVRGSRTMLDILQPGKPRGLAFYFNVGRQLPGSRIQTILADKEGTLWIGTNAGLARWTNGNIQRFPIKDSLASASILMLLEDHEGNLWVGTESDGVHILRDQRFRSLDARDGLSSDRLTTVVEDEAGTLWAGTQSDGLNALRRDPAGAGWRVIRTLTLSDGLASNVILSLAAAPGGDLWVGTPDGLNRIHGNRVETFTSADGLPDDFIRSLLIDTDGSLWIGTRRGLAHWPVQTGRIGAAQSRSAVQTYTHASGLGSDLVGAVARDANGDLWVATLAGLSRLHGGAISHFTTADGLSSNIVTALLPRADGTLLIGTQDHGWNIWDERKFSVAKQGGLEQTTVYAILDDGGGHLWFATDEGIARCDLNEKKGPISATGCARSLTFDSSDGLQSRETATNGHPLAWRSPDATLWFATPKGLVEVDSAHFPVNTLPPPVALERFQVDDAIQQLPEPGSGSKVRAGHVHFEFDYAGLSFVSPQKVRYRYMLEGFDRGWTEAGTRRAAYYTNIPPGRYSFRVQAANNDGIWNTAGAALDFELQPHLYQTIWFYAFLLALLAGTIALLWRRRLRAAEREFKAVLGERNRIAREIHDTLAQGYVGVSIQLEVVAELLRRQKLEDAANQLDKTREYLRLGLADARQSIWALRTQDADETTLPVKLRRIVEAAENSGLHSQFSIFGAYRALPIEVEREVLRIAQEAVHNVQKHSGATEISLQLAYTPESVMLEIRDNGRGGALDRTPESSPGHFGLTGMKERAAVIGGTLEVNSVSGEGTIIRLSAPARGEASGRTEVRA